MASCNPAELTAAAACFVCLSEAQQQAIRVRILCGIINGETMNCSPASLMEAAACIACGMDESQMAAVEVSLLCQIAAGGGGGGGGGVTSGAVNPVVPPPAGNGLYYNTSNSSLWAWDSVVVAWVPLIV